MLNSSTELLVLEINSFVRGYHAYKDLWTPVPGESLLVKREPTNTKDPNAVAVYKDISIVGHVPYNLARSISCLLRRDVKTRHLQK